MSNKLYALLLCLAFVAAATAQTAVYAPQSALSEGKWVKIRVGETGFYKITYQELKKMGFANPEKVSIHGYGGWPMDEDFAKAKYIDDMPTVAVARGADYILFYGKGTIKWTYNSADGYFSHENNAYSTSGYYFVTDATATGEVESIPAQADASAVRIDTYDDYMLHERELASITNSGRPNSGRDLFGESFDARTSQDFTFSVPGITNEDAYISFRFVSKIKSGSGRVSMSVNDVKLTENTINENTNVYVAAIGVSPKAKWEGAKSETVKVNIAFSLSGQTSHLDYIRLQTKRQLRPYGACTFFRSIASVNKASQFVISNATSGLLVFDVTDGEQIKLMQTSLNGSEATFAIPAGEMREFAAVDPSQSLPTPEIVGEASNQNLHGMPQTDMIILAPKAFISEAERLAEAHRLYDKMTVAVVTPEQVYNEFSSGTPEATAIRRFMKMFYDRSASDSDAPKHLLLFGDGRFDNRCLTDVWKNSPDTYLLTYQSRESIGESSYTSDDYFGFLHDGEGGDTFAASIDVGIGRFPVNTLAQARNAVDKVIGYIENSTAGAWKNKVCFVADDGNRADADPTIHARYVDAYTQYLENNHPGYVPVKLYFDAFKISYSGGKPTYPDVRTNLQKELKEGLLVINYSGHGDPVSWAEERVMTQTDINSFTYANLPLWITSTCDFAPFDAISSSAGEDVFLNRKSGGIALFTTTRVAYIDPNNRMNRLFINNLFEKKNGRHLTLGEVMKNTKNENRQQQLKCFVLIGDPALTLAYPDEYNMEVTEINGQPANEGEPVNFKAFERITVKGRVRRGDNSTVDDFNGLLSATVFDSRRDITTFDNPKFGKTITYQDYPNIIYKGNAAVSNGEFTFAFTVPKDISYAEQNGKISLYAIDEANGKEANGAYKNYTVGGTADVVSPDETGPVIRAAFLNTPDFKNGDFVNKTPMFTAIVWDENGLNVGGSSIGHDITLTIDHSPVYSYNLNSYYETYLAGESGDGIVKFPLPALEEGKHTAEFKIWDIYNNSSSLAFDFVVNDNYKPKIVDLTAGPSPARDHVNFLITHNLPESTLNVKIQVFDLTGRMYWQYEEKGSSAMFESYRVKWDLTDGAGVRLQPGVYVYRAVIGSNQFNETSESKKLIIIAQ